MGLTVAVGATVAVGLTVAAGVGVAVGVVVQPQRAVARIIAEIIIA